MSNKPTAPGVPQFNFAAGQQAAPGLPAPQFNFAAAEGDDEEGEDGDYEEGEPFEHTAETQALVGLQAEYDEIVSKLQEEERALLVKYGPLFKAVTDKRRDIINGSVIPPPLDSAKVVAVDEPAEAKGITGFWYTCMAQCNLGQIIEEYDVPALESLTDITTEVINGEKPGFSVHFHFKENAYFSNHVLSIVLYIPDFPAGDDVEEMSTTVINWKAKQNLCQVKKGKKWEDRQSFFHIFDQINLEDYDEEDEAFEKAMGVREMAATACFILREKVVPNAINWFTGEAVEDDEEGYEGEEYGEEGEEGEEDEEGEEGDHGDHDGAAIVAGAGAGAGAGGAEGEKPECKQQ